MSDNDGLAGNSSSNGGGVINDGGAVGAGHTTLSGAVEQADKAIRDSAASVVGFSDIDWNLFCDDLGRLAHKLDALDKLRLHHCARESEARNRRIRDLLGGSRLAVPPRLSGFCAFDPAKAENGDSQEGGGPSFDEEALRRE